AFVVYFFSSRRRHTRFSRDWSSDVCSSDLQRDRADDDAGRGRGAGDADHVARARDQADDQVVEAFAEDGDLLRGANAAEQRLERDRKSAEEGKRGHSGVRRITEKQGRAEKV